MTSLLTAPEAATRSDLAVDAVMPRTGRISLLGSGMQMQQLLSAGIYKQLSLLVCKKRLCCLEEGEDTWRGAGPWGSPLPQAVRAAAVPFSQQE